MSTNYFINGTTSVLHHYQTRLISSYENKLLYNIITPGVVPESGTITVVGVDISIPTDILIPSGFSLFISPNNKNEGGIIEQNFNLLSSTDQAILERQVLKCDIVKDFYVNPAPTVSGYLVAEYNYLEFSDLAVDFKIVSTVVGNQILLGTVTVTSGVVSIDTTSQNIAVLNSNILYEMNVNMVDGYHAMDGSGYSNYSGYSGVSAWSGESGYSIFVPVSDGMVAYGLNADMISGYSSYEVSQKWQMNSGFNVEFLADEFMNTYQPGNESLQIPISNKEINVNLSAELLNGSGYEVLAPTTHEHYLDDITDGVTFKKLLGVDSNYLLTNDSFRNEVITKDKIANECFFAKNDDLGGKMIIVTGQATLTANYSTLTFTPKHPTSKIFAYPPNIMLQIIDDSKVSYYNNYHIKLMAYEITRSTCKIKYTIYSASDGNQFTELSPQSLVIQYVAWGYNNRLKYYQDNLSDLSRPT